jgi:chromosome segregation ATPase
MNNPELKIIYDSEGRAIVDKEVLDLLLKEHGDLAERNHKLLQDYYAEAQHVEVQKDEIARLKAKLEMYEKEPKKSYVEQIMELQDEVKALRSRLHWIWAIGVDYDGCGTVESLKELIDEMVDFTQMTDEQVDDQLKAVKQLQQSVIELSAQKAELINQVQRLKNYDEERDERLHARLSDEAFKKGSANAAMQTLRYLYPLWQDTTSKEVAIGRAIEWIKSTFGV